jgi:hypothetical protein
MIGKKHSDWNTRKLLLAISAVAVLFILTESCRKKNYTYYLAPNVTASNDMVFLQRSLFHTFSLVVRACQDSAIMQGNTGIIDKGIVTYNKFQKKLTILYQNKTCADSVLRSGTITALLDGYFFSTGNVVRISYSAYKEDGWLLAGRDSLRSTEIAGIFTYSSRIEGMTLTGDSGRLVRWNSNLDFLFPSFSADGVSLVGALSVSGNGSGLSTGGLGFSFVVTNSFSLELTCPWVRSGNMSVAFPSAEVQSGSISYPNADTCNNRVTYDFEGNRYEWWMNKKKLSL